MYIKLILWIYKNFAKFSILQGHHYSIMLLNINVNNNSENDCCDNCLNVYIVFILLEFITPKQHQHF